MLTASPATTVRKDLMLENGAQAKVHKYRVYKPCHGFFALWLEEGRWKTPLLDFMRYRSLHLLYAAAGDWTRDPLGNQDGQSANTKPTAGTNMLYIQIWQPRQEEGDSERGVSERGLKKER